MTLFDIINNVLYEETLKIDPTTGKRQRGILFLDIDDTLLQAKNIFIWRKRPEDKTEVRLTPQQYAEEKVLPSDKKYYSYREFDDPVKVENSIINGFPYKNNLKVVDSFSDTYVIGILTARGLEDIVFRAITTFFKNQYAKGNMRKVRLNRRYVYAVNDVAKKYKGVADYEKKKNIIKRYTKLTFDYIYFMDDDIKNIKHTLDLKKELPANRGKKVRTIHAKEPNEKLNESYLVEMAVEDLRNKEFTDLIDQGKLEDAGHKYIELVLKNTPRDKKTGTNRFSGKSWDEITHAIGGQGLSRSINTALKKGLIDETFAGKVREAVSLAVKNPPKGEVEMRKAGEEIAKEDVEKSLEKITDGEDPEKDNFIIKVKKEIRRSNAFINKFIEKFLDVDYFTLDGDIVEDFTKNLSWINKTFLPKFIKSDGGKEESEEIEKLGRGVNLRKETIKTKWKLEAYKKALEEITGTVEYIVKFSGLKTKEEKIDELKNNVAFNEQFKKLNGHLSSLSPKDMSKDLTFKSTSLAGKASTRSLMGADIQSVVSSYFTKLLGVEKALNEGKLREFIKRNLKDLEDAIKDSTSGIRRGESTYKGHPEGFDSSKDIEEDEEFDEDLPEIYRRKKLGPKVIGLIKERTSKDYSYSGISRDRAELKYLRIYASTGKGTEEKAFRIFASMYLDFIDGVGIVASAKDTGKGKAGSGERNTAIEKSKKLIKREEQLRKMNPDHYGPKEARDLLFIRLQKMEKGLRDRAKQMFSNIDFYTLNDDELKDYVSLAKNFTLNDENLLKQIIDRSKKFKEIGEKEAKEIIDKELEKLSPKEKFENRVAISVNYNGGKFTEKQIVSLAHSILDDPTGKAFKEKLGTEEYSTRIQN